MTESYDEGDHLDSNVKNLIDIQVIMKLRVLQDRIHTFEYRGIHYVNDILYSHATSK